MKKEFFLFKNCLLIIFLLFSALLQGQQKASLVIRTAPDKAFQYWFSGTGYLSDYEQGYARAEKGKTNGEGIFSCEFSVDTPVTLNLGGLNKTIMSVLPVYLTPGSRDTVVLTDQSVVFEGTNADFNRCLQVTEAFLDVCNQFLIGRPSPDALFQTKSQSEFSRLLNQKRKETEIQLQQSGTTPTFLAEQMAHVDLARRMAFMYKVSFHIPDSLQTAGWQQELKRILDEPLDSPYFSSFREIYFFVSILSSLDYKVERGTFQDFKALSVENLDRLATRLSGNNLACAWATLINDDISRKSNNPVIPVLYNRLMERFPDNRYQSFLAAGVEENIRFNETKATDVSDPEYQILPCDSTFRSLTDVVKPLKGKVVYVDIWATWCVSCRAQFPYIAKMKEKTKGLDVVYLYISTDKPKDKEKWEKSIRHYEMKGYHLLAEPALAKALYQEFGNYVPHFMIIDKEGKLVERNAPAPEQLDALYEQLVRWSK